MKKISPFKKLYEIYLSTYSLEPQAEPEFFECIGDVFFTPEVQSLTQYPQHDCMDRLQHITSVSYISYRVCKKLGLDYRAAARAGIMHDLFYYDWHENDWSHRPHGYRHPKFAAVNAKTLCGDALDKKTEKMILRHMWPLTPVPPACREGFVLSLSDKYCASREMKITKAARKGDRKAVFFKKHTE